MIWYAPVQIGIVPISNNHYEYCKELSKKLKTIGLRVNLDLSDEKMLSDFLDRIKPELDMGAPKYIMD